MSTPFNPDKQHTIGKPVTISGTGLHTGILADLTLQPANPGFGLQFKRTDLADQPVIGEDGTVYNAYEVPFYIVHQYDRVAGLVEKIRAKYND